VSLTYAEGQPLGITPEVNNILEKQKKINWPVVLTSEHITILSRYQGVHYLEGYTVTCRGTSALEAISRSIAAVMALVA